MFSASQKQKTCQAPTVSAAILGPKQNQSCFITCQHLFLFFFVWGRDYAAGHKRDAAAGGVKEEWSKWWEEEEGGKLCFFHCSNHRCFFNTLLCWKWWWNEEFFPFFFLFVLPPGLQHTLWICLYFRKSQCLLHFTTYGAALPPTCPLSCAQRPISQYILL